MIKQEHKFNCPTCLKEYRNPHIVEALSTQYCGVCDMDFALKKIHVLNNPVYLTSKLGWTLL